MSSPDLLTRRMALSGLALLPALALGGCFRPMYAESSDPAKPGLREKLAAIEIPQPGDDRIGMLVRNKLSFRLTGGAEAPTPRYKLLLSNTIYGDTALVDALEDTPQIDTLTMTTDFTLQTADGKKVLFKAKANARKSYGSGLQRYGTIRAQRDAEDETADIIADQIRTRLGIYFTEHPDI